MAAPFAGSLIVASLLINSSQALDFSRVSTATTSSSWSVSWQPSRLVNGSPIIFRVAAPVKLKSLTGKLLDHDVYFAFDSHSKRWYGIAGISLETKEGSYPIQLSGITYRGTSVSFLRKITVKRASYPSIAVTVAKQFTEPSPEQLQKVAEDKTVKQGVFSQVNPLREWSGKFIPPANARTSDSFGTQRTFNGQVQSTHQGLDFAVPLGTPVSAVNSGTVLIARPMFFEGNCVMLDHGQGLLTIYMHLSEFKVKEGEHVSRGQIIALSGGTGRATGPHLHLAVRWEGLYLDPATLLRLTFP
jgi:murein DD-endopeptidase MepM/ murein hydrolase activator NlpD